MISLIVPCYNEQDVVRLFYDSTVKVMKEMDVEYEIIFVDDGSSDNTMSELIGLSSNDDNVVYLSFSRNFGKEAAMYAGFCNARGDYLAVLDADLQHPPELLPKMYEILQTGEYDSVATRRIDRKGSSFIKSWFAHRLYSIMRRFSHVDIVDGAQDFRMMKRDMVDAILSLTEYNRFSKGIFGWVGFRTKWLEHEDVERAAGESKWSFIQLVKYAIEGIVSFSYAPLEAASWLGVFITVPAFVYMIYIVIKFLLVGDPVAGWPTIICAVLFMGGLQLMMLGIVGEYLAKTYMECKRRPHYIIARSNRDSVKKIG